MIEIIETAGSIVLVEIELPIGSARILGDVRFEGNTLYVDRAHVEGLTPGVLGRSGIDAILERILVISDVERIVIQGAARTTGKYVGQVPRPIIYPR